MDTPDEATRAKIVAREKTRLESSHDYTPDAREFAIEDLEKTENPKLMGTFDGQVFYGATPLEVGLKIEEFARHAGEEVQQRLARMSHKLAPIPGTSASGELWPEPMEAALNAAVGIVMAFSGIRTGDFASHYWGGDDYDERFPRGRLFRLLRDYVEAERQAQWDVEGETGSAP